MKRISKILTLILVMIFILPVAGEVNAESLVRVERLSGTTRINTSIAVSKEAYPNKADTVIIAGYNGQADALTGTLLAHEKKAPVLISSKGKLDGEVLSEIQRLKASKVYILGGEAAVSGKVEKDLKAENLDVKRLKGKNRAGTAIAIAEEVFGDTSPKEAFIIESNALVDALSIGSVAAQKKAPILITGTNSVLAETEETLKKMNIKKATIIGGQSTVSDKGEGALKDIVASVGRVYGKGRVETALAVANAYNPNAKDLIIADGRSLPDALVGGYLSAQTGNPILLIERNTISPKVKEKIEKTENKIYILGGKGVINSKVEKDISYIRNGYRNADLEPNDTIQHSSKLNLNEKVIGEITEKDKDYFKIEIPKEGTLDIGLLSLEGKNLSLHLYGEDYEKGSIRYFINQSKGSLVEGLRPGTYYIRVEGYYSNTQSSYELDINYSPSKHEDENAGTKFIEAKKINYNSKTKGNIGYRKGYQLINNNDYFKIEVPKEGTLKLDLISLAGKDIGLYLYGEDYEKGTIKYFNWQSKGSLEDGIKAGTYYIKVESSYSDKYTPYELDVKYTPSEHNDERAGSIFANAKQIKLNDNIKGNIGYKSAPNTGNFSDYFKVKVSKKGTLDIDLSSPHGKNLEIYLYGENYEKGHIGNYWGKSKLNAKKELDPGMYYIYVKGGNSNIYSPYTLNLKFK